MAKLASGKKSVAISDRSGFKIKYTDLKTTWDGLRVEPSEWEPKHPQLTPAKNVVDATALFQPRPDNDPENVSIFYGYSTQDIFASRVERSQKGVGIVGVGAVGFLDTIRADMKVDATSVSGTGAIGDAIVSDNEDVVVTGVSSTGAIGTETLDIGAEASSAIGTGAIGDETFDTQTGTLTGLAGTGAIGTSTFFITTDAPVTGVNGTGAIGSETLESEISETGVSATGAIGDESLETEANPSGEAGTGAIGAEVPEAELSVTGVNGTGATEAFGVSGNGNVLLQVTGVSGIGATGAVGEEIGVAEAIETGLAGTGAIGTTSIEINRGFGEGAWSEGTWGE
jgi:hypothetical protein